MAWTEITWEQYRRGFALDLTDGEWALIKPLMPLRSVVGRPCTNAILYTASTGCQWRQLPKDFPRCSTVQGYFYAWSRDGRFAAINDVLVMAVREKAGREASPTAGVTYSQSVKTTERGGSRGFDKKIKGRKRHLSLRRKATLSGLSCMRPIFRTVMARRACWPRSAFSIRGCAMSSPRAAIRETKCAARSSAWENGPSSDVLPRRWVVERTLAWLSCRSPKTSKQPSPPWSRGCSSPTSGSLPAGSQGLEFKYTLLV
jgi:transposase